MPKKSMKGPAGRDATKGANNFLSIGRARASIEKRATFAYVSDNGDGKPGWDFQVRTADFDVPPRALLHGYSARFYAEGDPIPLENVADLSGVSIHLTAPFDPESGEVFFTLYLFEHGDLTDLRLRFTERRGDEYRMVVTATVPGGTVFSVDRRLRLETWIKRLPTKRYK